MLLSNQVLSVKDFLMITWQGLKLRFIFLLLIAIWNPTSVSEFFLLEYGRDNTVK